MDQDKIEKEPSPLMGMVKGDTAMGRFACVVISFLVAIASLVAASGAAHAQTPCLQSPEGSSLGSSSTRCDTKVCGIDCFACDKLLAAAAGCGAKPPECPTVIPVEMCVKVIPVEPVNLTIGTIGRTSQGANCPQGNLADKPRALKAMNGSVWATVVCQGGVVQSLKSVTFTDQDATASGSLCNWSYQGKSVLVSWAEGGTPRLVIGGMGKVIVSDLKGTSSGGNFSLTGSARAPLSDGSGYHGNAPVRMSFSVAGRCECK
jgi:hypothetical protein